MVLTLACCISVACYANYYRKARKALTVFYYQQLADHITPGSSSPSIPHNETCRYLEDHSHDISLLDDTLHDQDPWRRWTAAKTMGDYGELECIRLLRNRLEIEKIEYVRTRISQAIDMLYQRKPNGG